MANEWFRSALRNLYAVKDKAFGKQIFQSHYGHLLKEFFRIGITHVLGLPPDQGIRNLVYDVPERPLKFAKPYSASDFNLVLVQSPLPANLRHKRIIPLNLTYLAAYVLEKIPEVNVAILDCQLNNYNYFTALKQILGQRLDMVCIGLWTVQGTFAYSLAEAVKKELPQTTVVLGGVHPTVCPDDAVQHGDYLVLHEGEQTFAELVQALKDGKDPKAQAIKGIAWNDPEKGLVKTESRELIKDLNTLPFPALDLLEVCAYDMPLHVIGGVRLPIIASRGCPYDCAFCASPLIWQKKVRWRSAENVVAEMKEIIKKYKINYFHFWDDNFTLGRKFVTDFCTLVIRENLDIKWVCLDRAEHITRNHDLLPLMKNAGCVGVEIGMESANPDTFLYINKNQELTAVQEANKYLREAQLAPLYTCMAMNPGETINGYYLQKRSLDKMQEGLPWFQFFHPFPFPLYIGQFATPYPNTGFAKQTEELGMIIRDHPEDRFHHQINFIPTSLLSDVPLKNQRSLTSANKRLLIYAFWRGMWVWFDRENSLEGIQVKLREINSFINWYWERTNGKRTVAQLAQLVVQDLNFPVSKAHRFTAFLTYLLGQLGWIRSSLHNVEEKISPVSMKLTWDCELQLRQVLLLTR